MLIQSASPLNGEKIATYKTANNVQIEQCVYRAKKAVIGINNLNFEKQADLLNSLKQIILKNQSEIVNQIHQEIGKPLPDAEYEVSDIVSGIDIYLKRVSELKNKQKINFIEDIVPHTKFSKFYKNIGIVGLIMPWNFPFWMPMTVIIPAILSGNPVIFKPSEYACGVALLIEKIFQKSKLPTNIFQVLFGGPYVGSKLVNNKDVDQLFFVGSTDVGLAIARNRLKNKKNNMMLEMGGNSASIILSDANLDNAIPAVFWQGCYFAGQVCTGAKRLLIQKNVYEEVKQRLIMLSKKINQPTNLIAKIGPVITRDSMNIFEYKIEQTIRKGNAILTGGKRIAEKDLPAEYKNGNFFPTTVMEIINRDVSLINQETFAPILPLISFNTLDEAIRIANETPYGLSANIFGSDVEQISILKEKLIAGMIFINDSEVAYPGGNYWKGAGQSYFSTGSDDKLELMFDHTILWEKDQQVKRDYWFKE